MFPQGSCLVSEEEEDRFSLLISLSERGEQQAHLDKLKPYVIENLMVLFLAPSSTAGTRPAPAQWATVWRENSGVCIQCACRNNSLLLVREQSFAHFGAVTWNLSFMHHGKSRCD